ncbi:MAG: chitobiase/beta-hexosaminidase C-terminal domain-containing protein [Bacteroidaceae bacterium]|nr:chitobiase/beta-hexosaminidase C-terminal domain-containing protein [Bacteroidaceae bacterium]
MKKQLLKNLRLRAVMLVALLCAGISGAWGETYKLTINYDDFNGTSYAANNNEKTSHAVCTTDDTKKYEVKWISKQVMLQSSVMQWQKSNGSIYNTTNLGKIESVTLKNSTGSFTTYYGTTEQPTSNTTVGDSFFQVKVGSSTGTSTQLEVTFTITTPSITARDVTLEYNATSGSIGYSVSNPTTGKSLTASADETWISNLTVGNDAVTFNTTVNDGEEDRTATVTLSYEGATNKTITVTQKHYVIDFYTLPFTWSGGASNDLTALTGVTANGLGADYAESNAPYRVKFDNTGDYIQIKTDERPGKVSIGVKMFGGESTSTITVQGSSNGQDFTNVEELTISGSQNDILTLTTSEDFSENDRYVRLLFNKGSNVGVGPITISKYGSVEAPIFSPLGGTFYSSQSVTLTCTTEGATIKYSYDNSTWNDYSGSLTVSETTTIYAKAVLGNAESDVVSATYTIAEKNDVVLNIINKELPYGETYTITRGSGNDVETDGYITVSTSNANIVSVNNLKITAEAVGTATITLSVAEGNTYKAGEGTFTVTVTAPEGLTTAVESVGSTAVFDFTKEPEENTNEWGLPVTSTNKETGSHTYNNGTYTITLYAPENEGYYWIPGEKNGGQYLLMGKNGASLTLPAFNKAVTQIDVEGTSGASGKVTQNIFVGETPVSEVTTGANKTNSYSIDENHQAAGTIYTLKVTNGYNTQIKTITVHFADAAAPTIPVKLNSSGYATFCSQYPLDFTNATDYSAWIVTGVNGSDITFVQLTGSVKGGTGILLKGTPSSTINLPSVDSETVPSGNLLEGTLAPTYIVDDTYYGLVGNEFLLIESAEGDPDTDRIAPAGKAILPASVVNGNVKTLNFVFNDETGIREVHTISAEEAAEIFNLAGQRLQKPQRGVNIVNGKKVLVK